MTPEEFQAVEAAFARLIAAEPDERGRLLEALAADDPATAQRVRAMLEAEQRTPAWLRDDDAAGGEGDHTARAQEHEAPPQIEGFEVHRLIGRGGMGRVFEAMQRTPRRRVAIKVLDEAEARPRSPEAFEREINLLARLQHPGVAAIYTGGRTAADEPWFAMEYVEGPPISRAMEGMSARQFLEAFADACEIVAFAHEQGVLHLDLKPDHIVIGLEGAPKVVDFGLARLFRVAEGAGSTTAHIRGTLQYMSPQRLAATKPAPSDDVYAMGVILRTLLGDEDGVDGPQFGGSRRRALLRIARRAMAPEPGDRPSMRQMAASARSAIRATLAYRSAVLGGAAALLLAISGVGWALAENMGDPARSFAGEGIYHHPLGPGMSLPESEFGAQLERARAGLPFYADTDDPLSVSRQLGLLLEATGELEEARGVLRYLVEKEELAQGRIAQLQNRLFLARVLTKLGERDQAAQLLASIEADLPQLRRRTRRHLSTAVTITRALGLALDGRLDEAAVIMDDVLAIVDTGWTDWEVEETRGQWIIYRAHRTMAEIAERRGDAALAAQHRRMGLVEAPAEETVLPLGPGLAVKQDRLEVRIVRALAQVEQLEQHGAADDRLIEALLKLALLQEAAEDYTSAESTCRRLLAGSSAIEALDRFSAQMCLARSLARSERAGEAERLARRLLAEVPGSGVDAKRQLDIEAELYAALCLSLSLQQRLGGASEAIGSAIERLEASSPRWILYRACRALAELARQRGDDAQAAFFEETALHPDPRKILQRVTPEGAWGDGSAPADAPATEALHVLGPGLVLAESEFAAALEQTRAGEVVKSADYTGPENPQVASIQQALLLEAMGALEQARAVLEEVIASPRSGPPISGIAHRIYLARVMAKLGDDAETVRRMLDEIDAEVASLRARLPRLHLSGAVATVRVLALAGEGDLAGAEATLEEALASINANRSEWDSDGSKTTWVIYHAHRAMAKIAALQDDPQRAALHENLALDIAGAPVASDEPGPVAEPDN